jgi:hypothetical protein
MMRAMKQKKPAVRRAIVLGPQRHVPIVRDALDSLGIEDNAEVGFVSAGWEERETEDGEFREHVGRKVLNLEIWGRVERIFARDPDLLIAMRQRHDSLRRAQELYRIRLQGLLSSVRALLAHQGDEALVRAELAGAIAMVQALDREHMARIAELHHEFDGRVRAFERPAVIEHCDEIAKQMESASALCIAGGHIGVLLHRMQLFDVMGLCGDKPIIAWSAGAMALSQRIVLFHHGHAAAHDGVDTEVMESGLGALPGIVFLPHSRKRLDLHDRASLQILARRFAPDPCVLLDDGDQLEWDGHRWIQPEGTRTIDANGIVVGAAS